jgi:hypothetical protein
MSGNMREKMFFISRGWHPVDKGKTSGFVGNESCSRCLGRSVLDFEIVACFHRARFLCAIKPSFKMLSQATYHET